MNRDKIGTQTCYINVPTMIHFHIHVHVQRFKFIDVMVIELCFFKNKMAKKWKALLEIHASYITDQPIFVSATLIVHKVICC